MILCVFRAYDYNKQNSYRLKHLHKISAKNIADATKTKHPRIWRKIMIFKKPVLSDGITESTFECKRDGLTIRGTNYRPKGDHLPIAIVCHGFMAWQDSVKHYAAFLAEMGYAAFTFDFCGGSAMCGKSDGKTTEMSVLTETKDLEAVIEYVRTLSYTDSEKILLMGCSQGGFVSALVAAKNNFPIEKLVLFYPALCIPDDARAGKMMMVRFDPQNVPDTFRCGMMKLGRCYAMDVMQMDAFAEIKNYAGRVCIVHGTKDKIVDVSYANRAAEAYKSTMPIGMQESKRVQLHFIDGGGHMFSKKHDVIAMKLLKEFAAKHE